MAEYLTPGVYVEETSFRGKSIAAASTSVAAIIGPTRTGSLRGTPEPITSYPEYVRRYGDEEPLVFGGEPEPNYMALSARAFFDNGGKQLFVSRVVSNIVNAQEDGSGTGATRATIAQGDLTFNARFPGRYGDHWLEFVPRDGDSASIGGTAEARVLGVGGRGFMAAHGLLAADIRVGAPILDAASEFVFPINVSGTVRVNAGGDLYLLENVAHAHDNNGRDIPLAELTPGGGAVAGFNRALIDVENAAAPDRTILFVTGAQAISSSGVAMPNGTLGELHVPAGTDFANVFQAVGAAPIPAVPAGHDGRMRGTFHNDGNTFRVSGPLSNLPGNADMSMIEFLGFAEDTRTLNRLSYDIDVRVGGPDGNVVFTYGDVSISTNTDDERSLTQLLATRPERKEARDTNPVAALWRGAINPVEDSSLLLAEALFTIFNQHPAQIVPPPRSFLDPRFLVQMQGGTDGPMLTPPDYRGSTDEVRGSTGFGALEEVEDISIVATPTAAAYTPDNHFGVIQRLLAHCTRMRYRVGIVDARQGMSIGEVRDFRASIGDNNRLALYYPWVEISNPTNSRHQQPTMAVPPSGFIAGIYARTDVERGVHKAPANVQVIGAIRFAQDINRFQQELLNPQGINCLRFVDRRGNVVWGGRTLSTDVEWQYVNVRRYFLFLERSIQNSTTWAVFEPNGPKLWDNIRSAVEDFLYNEWFNGRLLGRSPDQAYFVRCDESTMTQADIDNGRMVCLVGVTPLRPAEFVIFRVGQKTADA